MTYFYKVSWHGKEGRHTYINDPSTLISLLSLGVCCSIAPADPPVAATRAVTSLIATYCQNSNNTLHILPCTALSTPHAFAQFISKNIRRLSHSSYTLESSCVSNLSPCVSFNLLAIFSASFWSFIPHP